MSERTTGVVLRVYPFSDTSLIVRWLTSDFGRISTIAKGARRPKSAFRGKLDLFYTLEFVFRRSRQSDLHTLQDVSLLATHEILRRDLGRLDQAAYCAALIEQTTEIETPLPGLFTLFTDVLRSLSDRPPQPHTILAFELKLLATLGLAPQAEKLSISAESKEAFRFLSAEDWHTIGQTVLTAAQIRELRQFLHGFLIYHLGKLPEGRNKALAG
jgi:DNA repair protein RecO